MDGELHRVDDVEREDGDEETTAISHGETPKGAAGTPTITPRNSSSSTTATVGRITPRRSARPATDVSTFFSGLHDGFAVTVPTPDLSGQVAVITGSTRGIGKALALSLAELGADVVSTGKTVDDSDTDLEGTIHKTADAVRERGQDALAVELDVRDPENCQRVVDETVDEFGRLDLLINNASAIQIADIADLPVDRFDLLMEVNVRGTYAMTRAALPHLRERQGRVITNAPALAVDRMPGRAPYAFSKMGMAFMTLSLAEEESDVAGSALWPVTAIETRATRYFGLGEPEDWRTPAVYCDAVSVLLDRDPHEVDGGFFFDEELLADVGVDDFSQYAVVEGTDPTPDSVELFGVEVDRGW